jgi:hypothetical protein
MRCVEQKPLYFAEIHALYTFATQRRTNGRRGRRLTRTNDQLDDLVLCYRFSGHYQCIWAIRDCMGLRRRVRRSSASRFSDPASRCCVALSKCLGARHNADNVEKDFYLHRKSRMGPLLRETAHVIARCGQTLDALASRHHQHPSFDSTITLSCPTAPFLPQHAAELSVSTCDCETRQCTALRPPQLANVRLPNL